MRKQSMPTWIIVGVWFFELYAIKSTERNGRAPLEGDVITDAKDEYDQFNNCLLYTSRCV